MSWFPWYWFVATGQKTILNNPPAVQETAQNNQRSRMWHQNTFNHLVQMYCPFFRSTHLWVLASLMKYVHAHNMTDFRYRQYSFISTKLLNIWLQTHPFPYSILLCLFFFKEYHENGNFAFFVEADQNNTALFCMQSLQSWRDKLTGLARRQWTRPHTESASYRTTITISHSKRRLFLNPKIRTPPTLLYQDWACNSQQKVRYSVVLGPEMDNITKWDVYAGNILDYFECCLY